MSNGVDISILFFPEELFIAWWVDFIKILLQLQVGRKSKRPFSLFIPFDFILLLQLCAEDVFVVEVINFLFSIHVTVITF